MKKLLILATACLTIFAQADDNIDVRRLSEAFGHIIGSNLEAPGFTFDLDGIIAGMQAAAAGEESPMTQEEYDQALTQIQRRAFEELAARNLDAADEFMEENAHHAGIVEIEEGKLQYRVEKTGTGATVTADSAPLVHYTGRYMDGTVFGTSTDGDPVQLPLSQTIPGFREGIAGMKEGEKRTIYVHPEMGYGVSGQLLPNSLLVFEVEILEAEPSSE